MNIRKANRNDVNLFFEWVNDEVVRQNSLNSNSINFDEHCIWYSNKLSNNQTYIYVGMDKETPYGQVRFDFVDDYFYIDYSIDKNYRGRGLSADLLKSAMLLVKNEVGFKCPFKAYVKTKNKASLRVFEKLNFTRINKNEEIINFLYED